MTLDRRLTALETALTPTGRIVRWLDAAHEHGTFDAYVDALLAEDRPETPLDRIVREAAHGARAGLRGKPVDQVDAAVHKALRETVFRYHLVLRINVVTHELLDRQQLLDALFSAHLVLLANADRRERRDEGHRQRLALTRDLVLYRVTELRASADARSMAESRYLDGHPSLFPDAVRAWDAQVSSTRQVAGMALRLAELDGLDPPGADDPDALAARTAALIADLVEPARSVALDQMGDGGQALRIATGWLRSKRVAPIDPTVVSQV